MTPCRAQPISRRLLWVGALLVFALPAPAFTNTRDRPRAAGPVVGEFVSISPGISYSRAQCETTAGRVRTHVLRVALGIGKDKAAGIHRFRWAGRATHRSSRFLMEGSDHVSPEAGCISRPVGDPVRSPPGVS
jgi:hypothetical protein